MTVTLEKAKPKLKLYLGCGQDKLDGFIGVDIAKTPTVDMLLDLEKFPWPWEDNSVETVVLIHTLEHIANIVDFMNELYRVMAPGGKVAVVGPHAQSYGCWQDPTHERAINEKFFQYFSKKIRESEGMKVDHYPIHTDFEIDGEILYRLEPEWKDKSDFDKAWAVKHLNNVIEQFSVTLKTIK